MKYSKTNTILLIIIIATISVGAGLTVIEHTQTQQRLIIATTTSTYETGLLNYLIPSFEARWRVDVQIVAVGTGQALTLGRTGDCDLLIVHARSLEDEFITQGYGVHRVTVWYNDFIIVGPESDPANVTGLVNVTEAFKRIYLTGEAGACHFYSRGDGSGTEVREKQIWELTGLQTPNPDTQSWYKRTGQGMSSTLLIANEDSIGYTITDRGTYASLINRLQFLEILVEKDKALLNPYSAILVNPEKFPYINFQTAVKFIAYICSDTGQAMIDGYEKNNMILFHSCYGRSNSTELDFDTDEQVAEYLDYWNPLIREFYS
ncbi:MAG: substrate-binding domain-containing protein [Candidatus Odinarchaeota archaeon]